MNKAAHAVVDAAVHTTKRTQGSAASRKRPDKTLRTAGSCTGNLVAFSRRQTPAKSSLTRHAESGTPGQQPSPAHSQDNRQMLASSAANHDQQAFSGHESLPAAALVKACIQAVNTCQGACRLGSRSYRCHLDRSENDNARACGTRGCITRICRICSTRTGSTRICISVTRICSTGICFLRACIQ